jgi:putative transposase
VPLEQRRGLIELVGCALSVREQCRLLAVPRSTVYYEPCGPKAEDLLVMRRLDEQYTATPFYGVERMTASVQREGICLGHNRVRRLLRLMGLEAIYPKPRLSLPGGPAHRIYPYRLRGLRIERPNQVWSADITYIRLSQGFVYLVAILDWFSRYVLSWSLSTTLDAWFCVQALREALRSATPEIFNTDQGSQFTSGEWITELTQAGVTISMDGRGRAFDNIFTERLWRSVKYEEVYLKDYAAVDEAREGLGGYFGFYNTARPHQALGYRTPVEVHFECWATPTSAPTLAPGAPSRQRSGAEKVTRCNNVTGRNKKEKEAKRKKMLLLL